jgi:hypothetical protein
MVKFLFLAPLPDWGFDQRLARRSEELNLLPSFNIKSQADPGQALGGSESWLAISWKIFLCTASCVDLNKWVLSFLTCRASSTK